MSTTLETLNETIKAHSVWVEWLRQEIGRVIVGQHYLIDRLIIGLVTNGHILLEGVPGLAKTLSVRTLAAAIQAQFHRSQFTSDLLPVDIIGTLIYNPLDRPFSTKKGPIFGKSSWLMKSIGHQPKCGAPCSKRCRNAKSPSATPRIRFQVLFWRLLRKSHRPGRHLSATRSPS